MPATPVKSNLPLSQAVRLRRDITRRTLEVFGGWCYSELDVPLLDDFDELRGVIGEQSDRTIRFVDRDGHLMMLRSDITPAIAKLYAHHLTTLPLPLRVSYASKVVRDERVFSREQIELHQVGFELLGAPGLCAELEAVLICDEVMRELGVDDFVVNVGHIGVYRQLVELSGIPRSLEPAVRAAVVNRDPVDMERVLHRVGARPSVARAFSAMAQLPRMDADRVTAIRADFGDDRTLRATLDHLEKLVDALTELLSPDRLRVDLGELRGHDYYTGVTFALVSEGIGREIGGGGRYDKLTAEFGATCPAVGFAFQVDALIELLHPDASAVPAPSAPAGGAVRIDPARPVSGFRKVLARRAEGEVTRVVARSESRPTNGRRGRT